MGRVTRPERRERATPPDASAQRVSGDGPFLAQLLAAVEEAVVAVDVDGRIIYWNRHAWQLFGWTAHEILGRSLRETIVPRTLWSAASRIFVQLKRGASWNGEFIGRRRDGTTFPAHVTLSPLRDSEGAVVGLVGVSWDITERKRADRRLREAEARYREIVESARAILWRADAQTLVFTYVSREAETLLGYPTDRWITEHDFWYRHTHPDDRDWVVEFWRRATAEGKPHEFDYRMIGADGTVVWLRDSVQVSLDERGRPQQLFGVMMDITAQKHAEAQLRDSERRYRLATRAAFDAIWEWDLRSDRVTRSQDLPWRLGYDPSDLGDDAEAWLTRIHPDDRDRVRHEMRRVIESGLDEWQDTYRVRRGDGSYAWVADRACVERDARGTPIRVVGAVLDITLRKETEEALRHSERAYRLLFDRSPIPKWVFDAETLAFLTVNDAAVRHYGYSRDEFLRMTIKEIRPPEAVSALEEFLEDFAPHRSSHAGLWQHQTKDGRLIDVEVYGQPITYEGRPALMVDALDVTERRGATRALEEVKERFVTFFRSSPVPMAITTLEEGRFLDVNEKYEEFLGLPREAILDRTSTELGLLPDPRRRATIVSSVREQGFLSDLQTQLQVPNGKLRDVLATLQLIEVDGQECLLGAMIDVTDRMEAERIAESSRRQLRALSRRVLEVQERERARIARELHDQIGQALTAVKISLEAVRRGPVPAGLRAPVAESVHLVDRAIQQVRTLSFDLRPAMLDDLGLPAAVGAYAKRQAAKVGLELQLDVERIERSVPKEIETACFRVMQEAVTNAVRHAEAACLHITLQAVNGTLELVVRDDGRGFDPATLHGEERDADLGLVGMQERAQFVGGTVRIESRPNRGTEVRAYFPIGAGG